MQSVFSEIWGIRPDYDEMVGLALDRLAAAGCKTVGTISPDNDMYPRFEQAATARGLTTMPRWCHHQNSQRTGSSAEGFGYRFFKEIWAQQVRPAGLFVQYDWTCRGAITAILELGVRIPQDLQLVLYRNEGVDYLCPWTVPYVVLDTNKVASLLVDFVIEQHRSGKHLKPPSAPLRIAG